MDKQENEFNDENDTVEKNSEPSFWPRLLYMILFAIAFGISESVMYLVAIVNLIFLLVKKEVHSGLRRFGKSLATYLQQIASFLTFNTEYLPFPFNEWPSATHSNSKHDSKGE